MNTASSTESLRTWGRDRRARAYSRLAGIADRLPGLAPPPPYNVTVSDDPAFVWYRVAKVGTRTIYRHLHAQADLRLDHPYAVRLPRSRYQSHFHFAFVRNPWDRLVSCWHSKVLRRDAFGLGAKRERMRSFPAFVDYVSALDLDGGPERCNAHLVSQRTLIDLGRVDFIGRFERFAADLSALCQHLGLLESFDHRNPTDHQHYSAYYDDRTAEIVGRLYERDVRLFGYDFTRVAQPGAVGAGAGE